MHWRRCCNEPRLLDGIENRIVRVRREKACRSNLLVAGSRRRPYGWNGACDLAQGNQAPEAVHLRDLLRVHVPITFVRDASRSSYIVGAYARSVGMLQAVDPTNSVVAVSVPRARAQLS